MKAYHYTHYAGTAVYILNDYGTGVLAMYSYNDGTEQHSAVLSTYRASDLEEGSTPYTLTAVDILRAIEDLKELLSIKALRSGVHDGYIEDIKTLKEIQEQLNKEYTQ